jgi:small ubiquitin-related modifier
LVEIKELCIFLVVKYSVADIDIPSRLSPSISVDNTWHWLLLFPSVYASTCQRAYELAAIITENDFAYSAFPRVVDHNPNSANDLKVVKEQRRRATLVEMTRLGLLSITAEENNETEEETEEGTEEEEEEAEGEEEDEEPLREDNASREEEEEEEQESKKGEAAFTVLNIRVKDQTGEETMFRIKNTTSFGKIMNTYASRKGVRAGDLMFFLDGERIEPYQTIADLDLEDEDQVDCLLAWSGC